MADEPQIKQIPDLDLAQELSDLDWLIVSQNISSFASTRKVRFADLKEAISIYSGGQQVELRKSGDSVQWKYSGETVWRDLVALSEITGPQGATGAQGLRGATGEQGIAGATGIGETGATGASGVSDRYKTTSTTPLTIGYGPGGKQTLTVDTDLSYTPNQHITISQSSDAANHMHASVDSYGRYTGQMIVTVTRFSGSGSASNWTVNLSGAVGVPGATGEQGPIGATGADGATGPSGQSGSTGLQGPTGASGLTGATGDRYSTTSNTSLTVGDGDANFHQTLTVEQGLSYTPNQNITITMASNVANHMHGYVFSYDKSSGVLVARITSHTGNGQTSSLWTVNLAGAVGTVGATGFTGATGPQGSTGLTGATGPAGNDFTIEANAGLVYQNNVLSTIYNTLVADSVNSTAVGGASAQAAAVWKAKTLVDVLDSILFPDLLPTYTIPTLSIGSTQSGVLEIGTPINQTITLTATENDAGAFSYLSINRAGSSIYNTNSLTAQDATDIASQYGYNDPNNPNKKYVVSYNDTTGTVTASSITWTGSGDYAAGLAKKNNKGVDDTRSFAVRSANAPQAASTGFQSSSVSVSGIYPYFYGKSSTAPTAGTIATQIASNLGFKVLTAASDDLTITFNASAEYVWLAVYADYPLKTRWYNTALNNGNIGDGQFILSSTSYAISSPQGLWSGKTYNIYISSGATNTEGSIIFQN